MGYSETITPTKKGPIMKSWTELCQMNVDHYNAHPTQHNAITIALAVGAVVVSRKFIRRIAREDYTLRSGMYA